MKRESSFTAVLLACLLIALSHALIAIVDPDRVTEVTPVDFDWWAPVSDTAPPATLVITNETDATLTVTFLLYEGGRSIRLPKTVPPRQIVSFFNQLPRGAINVEAAPQCVPGVGGALKPLVVGDTGRYRSTFQSHDFGKPAMLDRSNCGSDETHAPCPAREKTGKSVVARGPTVCIRSGITLARETERPARRPRRRRCRKRSARRVITPMVVGDAEGSPDFKGYLELSSVVGGQEQLGFPPCEIIRG